MSLLWTLRNGSNLWDKRYWVSTKRVTTRVLPHTKLFIIISGIQHAPVNRYDSLSCNLTYFRNGIVKEKTQEVSSNTRLIWRQRSGVSGYNIFSVITCSWIWLRFVTWSNIHIHASRRATRLQEIITATPTMSAPSNCQVATLHFQQRLQRDLSWTVPKCWSPDVICRTRARVAVLSHATVEVRYDVSGTCP